MSPYFSRTTSALNWALKTLSKPILSPVQENRYPVPYRNQCVDEDTTASTLNQPFPVSCSFLPDYRQFRHHNIVLQILSKAISLTLMSCCCITPIAYQKNQCTETFFFRQRFLKSCPISSEIPRGVWLSSILSLLWDSQQFGAFKASGEWAFPSFLLVLPLSGSVRNTGITVLAFLHACGQSISACDNQFCKNKVLHMEYPLPQALEGIHG